MAPKIISSHHNPLAQRFRQAGREKRGEAFLMEGRHLLQEALSVRWPLEAVLLREDLWESWAERLSGLDGEGKAFLGSGALLERLCRAAAPEGVLALGRRPVAPWPAASPGLYLFLDEVQDPVNVGMLIRSARAFGLRGVFAGTGTAEPFHPTVLSRSAGAALHVPCLACTAEAFLGWARAGGVRLLGADARGEPLPPEVALDGPWALVLGNEGRGMSGALAAACERLVAIPMAPGWDSLNVAVAGSIFMHALSRPR